MFASSHYIQKKFQFLTMAYECLKHLGLFLTSHLHTPHLSLYCGHNDLLRTPQTCQDYLCARSSDLLCSWTWYILLTDFFISFRALLGHKKYLPWPLQLKEHSLDYLLSHVSLFFQYHLLCLSHYHVSSTSRDSVLFTSMCISIVW